MEKELIEKEVLILNAINSLNRYKPYAKERHWEIFCDVLDILNEEAKNIDALLK